LEAGLSFGHTSRFATGLSLVVETSVFQKLLICKPRFLIERQLGTLRVVVVAGGA
jgi:hypothetical protein